MKWLYPKRIDNLYKDWRSIGFRLVIDGIITMRDYDLKYGDKTVCKLTKKGKIIYPDIQKAFKDYQKKIYNVYIVKVSGEAVSLIGENMSKERAEKRVMMSLVRIDKDNYYVAEYEVDSKADKRHKKEVIKNK